MKIEFKNPVKNQVVIFDVTGADVLSKLILKEINFTTIFARKEKYHVSMTLIFLFIKNLVKAILKPSLLTVSGMSRGTILSVLSKLYYLSLLNYIKPKLVLTFIDNSSNLQWLSQKYKGCEFFAIQNGVRTPAKRLHYLGEINVERSIHYSPDVINLTDFFCFGRYEIDLYQEHGHKVGTFHPIGSLKGGYYKHTLSKSITAPKFDLCLVSDQLLSFPEGYSYTKFELGVSYLHKLVRQCLSDNDLSFCVAMRSADINDQKLEKAYFRSIFGEKVQMSARHSSPWSTYEAMENSDVIVTLNSTAAFEAFGWGKKVLFCNLSGDDFNQVPLPDICRMNENNIKSFKDKLNSLRIMDQKEYEKKTKFQARYLMNYDFDNPAHVIIRNKIKEYLV